MIQDNHRSETDYAYALAKLMGMDGNPPLEARLLVEKAERDQPENIRSCLDLLLERRLKGEPLAYIIGEWEFWGLPFSLSVHTLIPRPDTETLVEQALALADNDSGRILDLGTGSGCILLAFLSERSGWQGIGVDISEGAVQMAVQNAAALNLQDHAQFHTGAWFDGLGEEIEPFDLIVSNPPYIETGTMQGLMPSVRDYEPGRALDGGTDGLDAYKRIICEARSYLKPNGYLIFEIGVGQEVSVLNLMAAEGFVNLGQKRDLPGHIRVVYGVSPE